jgi:hypothetical protein
MFRFLVAAVLVGMFSPPAMAHKCILKSNDTADITAYNFCKNDLATGSAGHEDSIQSERVKALELENAQLLKRLRQLKADIQYVLNKDG